LDWLLNLPIKLDKLINPDLQLK